MKKIVIEPRRVVINLSGIALFVAVLHVISYIPIALGLRDEPIHLFNMDDEHNFAALYASLLLFFCAVLNWYIAEAQSDRRARLQWKGWVWIFIYLALDESLAFHERIAWPVHRALSGLNLYGFAWLVPYGAACAILALVYARFWWALPRDTRIRMALGVLIFVAGAMGCELVGWILTRMQAPVLFWHLEILVEELLEMAGGIVLVMAYVHYITTELPGIRLGFVPDIVNAQTDEYQ